MTHHTGFCLPPAITGTVEGEEIALTADLGCLLILVISCFAVISSMRSRTFSLESVLVPVLPAYMRSSGITG